MADKTLREKIEAEARSYSEAISNIDHLGVRNEAADFLAGHEATLRLLADGTNEHAPSRVFIMHEAFINQNVDVVGGIWDFTDLTGDSLQYLSKDEHIALRAQDQIEIERLNAQLSETQRLTVSRVATITKERNAEREGRQRAENNYFLSIEARILAESELQSWKNTHQLDSAILHKNQEKLAKDQIEIERLRKELKIQDEANDILERDFSDYKKNAASVCLVWSNDVDTEHAARTLAEEKLAKTREARAEAFKEAAKILWDEAEGDIGFAKSIFEELSVPSSPASIERLRKTVEQQLKRAESVGSAICPHGE